MTVISILQPWATLVVIGAKLIETRSWNTPFTGELLIHASLGKTYGPDKISCRELCYQEPFSNFINGGLGYDKLPKGAILGKVNMIKTAKMDDILFNSSVGSQGKVWHLDGDELSFGNYSEGRFAWLLSDPVQFAEPIPAKGKLGFWNFDNDIDVMIK